MTTSSKAVIAALICCSWLASCSRNEQQQETVAKASAALNTNPKLSDFALYATNSVLVGESALVSGGDIGVTTAGPGPFLASGFELAVSEKAQLSAGRSLIADAVLLGDGAKVGDVQTNRLTDNKSTHGQLGPFIALPPLPGGGPVMPGDADLSIAEKSNVTMPAGASYRKVTIGAGAVVRLAGGTYQFAELALAEKARLEATTSTELHIAGRLSLGASIYVGPASGTALSARDVRLEVSAINGALGGLNETPFAATVGEKSQLRALVLVPNGRLTLGEKVLAQGAFFGRDVEVRGKAQVTFQDGFSTAACGSCDDGNACTTDACSGGVCTHKAVLAGAPCSDGDPCNGAETCNAAAVCVVGTAVVCTARDVCHLAGTCDPRTGACSDPAKPDTAPCDDADACTDGDACQAGVCVPGSRVQCVAPDQCHQVGSCDPKTGACTNPVKANGDACDDGNPCTTSDTCLAGACRPGNTVVCAAADQCHAPGSCDVATGLCSNPPLDDPTVCNDGDACTAGDTCRGGNCQSGQLVATDDGNSCTSDSCDRASGPKHLPLAVGAACPEGFCLGSPLVCTPLAVHIDSPASLITVGSFPVEVKGSVNTPSAILTVNGVAVANVAGKFAAAVALEEGHNTVVVRAVDGSHESTDSVSISLDLTPPYVTIQSPADQQVLYTDKVTVTGLINDIVRGTIEATQARVTVNGVEATISNRSYAARDVPLLAGDNVLTVFGTDQVGNIGQAEIHVQRVIPTGRRLQVVSGQDQVATIGVTLPAALAVRVVDDALTPVAGAKVAFRVTEGSGLVSTGTADEARAVLVTTDAQGLARARFKLGLRSGSANHKVRAKVVGFDDEALFYASAVSKPGNKISVNSGNNQRGSVGQPLPEPLVVVVTDQGANVVQGASVRFAVTVGSGTLTGGATTFDTQTDSDGRATAEYTPGPLGGLDAQRLTATLLSATGSEVINAGFTATAFVPADPGLTTISGVVLDNQDTPLPGVTLRALGTTRQAVSNAQGQFRITEAPVGPVHLLADGSTTTAEGEYPSLSYNLVTVAGVDNPLPAPMYMVKLDTANSVLAGPADVALELPNYPGFKLEIAKGSVTFPDGAKQGRISVTPVNASAVPMAPPNGMQPQFIVTIQPTGTRFDPPARLTLPNVDGLPAGTQTDMYSYDHDLEEFVSIGLGTVSEDGTVLTSNHGVGVIKAGWHCGSQPSGQGCASGCGDCQTSDAQCNCHPDQAQDGQSCTAQSGGAGLCSAGQCVHIDITGLQSNQIEGVAGNYLPEGSGRPVMQNGSLAFPGFIFVGPRADGRIHVRVLLGALSDPNDQAKVAIFWGATTRVAEKPVGPPDNPLDPVDLSFDPDPQSSAQEYWVGAGFDRNDNGLEPAEVVTGPQWRIRAPSLNEIESSFQSMWHDYLLSFAAGPLMQISRNFLGAFLEDNAEDLVDSLAGGTSTVELGYVNDPKYNIGILFSGSSPPISGPVVHNYFSNASVVYQKVMTSEAIEGACHNTVSFNFESQIKPIVSGLNMGDSETVEVDMWGNLTKTGMSFESSLLNPAENDLHFSFGRAAVQGRVRLRIQKIGLAHYKVIEAEIVDVGPDLRAAISDSYDWDVSDLRELTVQSGYRAPGGPGHIFRSTVYIAGPFESCKGHEFQ